MADTPQAVGTRIARRRHQLGWTQIELADRLGVSPSTVANWERGATYPKKKLGKVEHVLGVRLDEGPADPEPPPELNLPGAFVDEVRRMFPAAEDQLRMYEFIRLVRSGRLPRREAESPDERRSRSAGLAG